MTDLETQLASFRHILSQPDYFPGNDARELAVRLAEEVELLKRRAAYIDHCWRYWYGVEPHNDRTLSAEMTYRHCSEIMRGICDGQALEATDQPTGRK